LSLVGLVGEFESLGGLRLIPALLGDASERSPHPADELSLAELL
jgi:hypothetical protein